MACLLLNQENIIIKIPSFEIIDGVTYYIIEVKVDDVNWTLKHRYNEFAELHEILVSEHCVEKDLLPPKKLIGNKNESFIEKRRVGLAIYLNSVYNYLKKTMPRELALFLDLHVYDIFFLLQNMALNFFIEGDSLLQSTKKYNFTPIQVMIQKNFGFFFSIPQCNKLTVSLSKILLIINYFHVSVIRNQ